MGDKNILDIEQNTQGVYERNGERFDTERSKTLFEKVWLDRFAERLPKKAKILDVGCGAGEPIAQYLIERGFDVTGIDFSNTMLDIIRRRYPDNEWHHMDMRQLNFPNKFDGIIAWHSFFHLTRDDQKTTLQKFADYLAPGGILMLTVGYDEGEAIGHVGGEEVYHASFAYEDYEMLLNDLGITVVDYILDDPECGGASILLAQKKQ